MTFGELLIYVSSFFGLIMVFYFLITYLVKGSEKKLPKKQALKQSVSIIVPAYNEEKTLSKTIESLLALHYDMSLLEIIIVNDGSTDNTSKIAQQYAKKYSNIIVINQENSGKGRALNSAIKRAKGEFVGALDADSYVDKDALLSIMKKFTSKDIVSVTPAMKVYDAKTFLQWIQEVEYIMGIYLRKVFSILQGIHVTPGPFSIFRKSFFEKYGFYDEENLTEDIEIALRIQKNNYHIENSTDAFVYTKSPATFKALYNQRIRWYKGFFDNIKKYTALFSLKYSALGVVVLPSAIISITLAMTAFIYTGFILVENIIDVARTMYLLGLNFFYLQTFSIDFFTLTNRLVFLGGFSLFFSLIVLIIAHSIAKGTSKSFRKILLFSFTYWFFFGSWWLIALYYSLTKKKIRWGKKYL